MGGIVGRNTMHVKRRVLYWTSRKPINGIRVATYGGEPAGVGGRGLNQCRSSTARLGDLHKLFSTAESDGYAHVRSES